ncbi:MAG: FkbM family methyltransferase [Candidatus Omnitrophica bacterium]|nr:FkbM family methyltransferase [Candidatus Omnitrophota bacterium]MCM8816826.1 FkbM family methyltransferase [Candidatus Omnitrophota bacterium]
MILKDVFNRAIRFLKQVSGKDVWNWRQVKMRTLVVGKERYVICPDLLTSRSIVYSVGIGDDISFDLDIIEHFGATIYGFDPSPSSVAWIEKYNLPFQFKFFPYGVSDHDGEILLYRSENVEDDSVSLKGSTKEAFEAPVMRLSSIMKELGHTRIDLLKLDIEGMEYSVIKDMIDSEIKPMQLVVEFHHRFPEIGISMTKDTLRLLKKAGYKIVYINPSGDVYTFVRTNLAQSERQQAFSVYPNI